MKKKPVVYVVAGQLFGDEGKGTTVEYLAHTTKAELVVRYSGGPQAMHHCVTPKDEKFHCFSQFCSHTLLDTKNISLLSKFMFISPHSMLVEAEHLERIMSIKNPMKRVFIDKECFIITPLHKLINRTLELLRGDAKYGTTGMGVGPCVNDAYQTHSKKFPLAEKMSKLDLKNQVNLEWQKNATCLQVKDLLDENTLFKKIQSHYQEKRDVIVKILKFYREKKFDKIFEKRYMEVRKLDDLYSNDILQRANEMFLSFLNYHTPDSLVKFYSSFGEKNKSNFINGIDMMKERLKKNESIIFEGAQGSLLDRIYGVYPHVTKTICSIHGASSLLNELKDIDHSVIRIGVFRTFSSRHGHGPLMCRIKEWDDLKSVKEIHNKKNEWQSGFRIGPFDGIQCRYGMKIFGEIDVISLTSLDKTIKYHLNDINMNNMNKNKPPFITPICNEYIIHKKCSHHNEDVKKILNQNELLVTKKDINGNIRVKDINKLDISKVYRSMNLLAIFENSNPIFTSSTTLFNSNMSNHDKQLKQICKNFILKRKLMKHNHPFFDNILNHFVLIQQLLKKKVAILSFGAHHTDKVFVNKKLLKIE